MSAPTFGERLKAAMVLRGMRNKDLAQALAVDQKQVERWRGDKHEPQLATAAAIAGALRVSLDYLAGRSDDPEPAASPSPRERGAAAADSLVDQAAEQADKGNRRRRNQAQGPLRSA